MFWLLANKFIENTTGLPTGRFRQVRFLPRCMLTGRLNGMSFKDLTETRRCLDQVWKRAASYGAWEVLGSTGRCLRLYPCRSQGLRGEANYDSLGPDEGIRVTTSLFFRESSGNVSLF